MGCVHWPWCLWFSFTQALPRLPAALSVSNILFWMESDYFDTASELKPLLHTWSLGVEEQFYVLFPLVLAALWKLSMRWRAGVLAR